MYFHVCICMSFSFKVRRSVPSSAIFLPPSIAYSPCIKYACHVWGGSTHTALVDRVESKAFRLIRSPPVTSCLLPLKFRRSVTSLSIFYRYFHSNCSSELANCMPPLLPRPHCTRRSSDAHSYTVQTPYARVIRYLFSFVPLTGKLCKNLPAFVFPTAYV